MAQQLINDLQLVINDELIAYVPKSLKYTSSTAKVEVKALTTGGTGTSSVHSLDATESLSKVSFDIKATKQTLKSLNVWFSQIAKNVIELSSANGDIAGAFVGMSLIEMPMLEFGADANITVEFVGDSI